MMSRALPACPAKEALFVICQQRRVVQARTGSPPLRSQLAAAIAALSRAEDGLEKRLIAACVDWSGRFVGLPGRGCHQT